MDDPLRSVLLRYASSRREWRRTRYLGSSRSFRDFVVRLLSLEASDVCYSHGIAGPKVLDYQDYVRKAAAAFLDSLEPGWKAERIGDPAEVLRRAIGFVRASYAEPCRLEPGVLDDLDRLLEERLLNLNAIKPEYLRVRQAYDALTVRPGLRREGQGGPEGRSGEGCGEGGES